MKIWFLWLIPFGVAMAGTAHSQDLTIDLNDVTLREALHAVETKANTRFFITMRLPISTGKVSVHAKNESLRSVLDKLLAATGLTYTIMENNLVVIAPRNLRAQAAITGQVLSAAEKQPLPGVNVTIKGTIQGTITNIDGRFTIEAPAGATLVFSFIGYTATEVPVGSQTNLRVELKEDITTLHEVTVVSTGYQEVDQRLFTGSVVKLAGSDVKTDGTMDVSRMLQAAQPAYRYRTYRARSARHPRYAYAALRLLQAITSRSGL